MADSKCTELKELDKDLTDKAYQKRMSEWLDYLMDLRALRDELVHVEEDAKKLHESYSVRLIQISPMFRSAIDEVPHIKETRASIETRYDIAVRDLNNKLAERLKGND